jgi:hypothetical protein
MISVKDYHADIDKIRSLRKKKKRKIILKIKFLNFPQLESADLQIYPGRSKGSDGTNEKPITFPPHSPAASLASNSLVIGNSHVDLKKVFGNIKKKDKGYIIFTPVLSTKYPDHLVFDFKVVIDGAAGASDSGQSNPCPPAKPGGTISKKKK